MNQPKNTQLNAHAWKILLTMAASLVVWTTGAAAQEKLGDLVTEGGFDWMIGSWTATTDQGDKISLAWTWELDKHVLNMHLKWPNYEYRGMIYYVPAEDKIVQVGADDRGGNGKGVWESEDDKAILKYENTDADGQTRKIAMVHSRVDKDTMKVEVYKLSDTGQLSESPVFTTQYKRLKKQTPPKAQSKAGNVKKSILEQETDSTKIVEFQVVH
jgi:hypothetical protein